VARISEVFEIKSTVRIVGERDGFGHRRTL